MITPTPERPRKRSHAQPESNIQVQCFTWFWNEYPEYRGLFFHVENENSRSKYESKQQQQISGARRKMMGVVAGVSDMIGLIPKGIYHGFCAECKTKEGRQSSVQKEWERTVTSAGYYYFVFRSIDDFRLKIEQYLRNE